MITIADMSPPPTTMIGPRTKVVVSNHGNGYSVYFQGRLVAEFRVVGPQPDRGRFHTAAALLSPGIDVDIEKNPEWQIVKKNSPNVVCLVAPQRHTLLQNGLPSRLRRTMETGPYSYDHKSTHWRKPKWQRLIEPPRKSEHE